MLLRASIDDGNIAFSLDGSVTAGGGRLGCRWSRLRFALIKRMKSNTQTFNGKIGKYNTS